MASKRGELIAERVKMLEHMDIAQMNSPPLRLNRAPNNNMQGARQVHYSRSAPAAPHQRGSAGSAASAPYADAESAVPLLPTHGNLDAASKMAGRVRVLPVQTHVPIYDVPPPYSAHAAENVKLDHTETDPGPPEDRSGPREPLGTILLSTIHDQFSAVTLWIQRSAPLSSLPSSFSTITDRYEKKMPIKRTELKLGLLIFMLCLLFFLFYRNVFAREDTTYCTEIDEYFHHLNYSPDELLIYEGETLKAIPKDGELKRNRCVVIEREKKSVSNGKSDIGVVASNVHRTFPGSLLLANRRLVDNSPDVLAVGRAPLTYTVNLPRLTSEGSFTIVPSFSKYQSAVNNVLNKWFDKYADDGSTAANFQIIECLAYSKHLLRVQFGLDFMNSVIESSIDFNVMGNVDKLIKIIKFTQVFYTVSVEPAKRPSDLFDSGVTLTEIEQKTDDKDPPVLVDCVSYGRSIYLKIETSSIDKQAELSLSVMGRKFGLKNAQDLKDLRIQVYVLGGNTNQTKLIDAGEINEVITQYSKFSKDNLGFPIYYSSQFINDNKKAIVHFSTDYFESERQDNCRKGVIKLIQRIMFVQWEVTWTEISYDANGNKVVNYREWDKNSKVIKIPFQSEEIEIPGNVEDLRVVAKALTLLDSWRTLINRSNIPIIPRREFHVTGHSTSEVIPPI